MGVCVCSTCTKRSVKRTMMDVGVTLELEDRGVPLLPLPPLFLPPPDVSTCFGRFFFEL